MTKKKPSVGNNGHKPTSTVGRGKAITLEGAPDEDMYTDGAVQLHHGDSLELYDSWAPPNAIISDGAYGILGFEGDTSCHLGVPEWYEPHVARWAEHALPSTTLWFWNSEIGWAAAHPVLERHGWRYVSCNIWYKGKGHIAGNVNTAKIRRFPVATEVCVQYVRDPVIHGQPLKAWLRSEWRRAGLVYKRANEACGVKDAATRKYFDQGHLWYFPPAEAFEKLVKYANEHGQSEGRPYYSEDGVRPLTGDRWADRRPVFNCPHGHTNVWERPPVRGAERVKTDSGKAVHLNQKPLDLMRLIIDTSTLGGGVIWEPFGGLFSASIAAKEAGRRAYAAELDSTYFQFGVQRFADRAIQRDLFESGPPSPMEAAAGGR